MAIDPDVQVKLDEAVASAQAKLNTAIGTQTAEIKAVQDEARQVASQLAASLSELETFIVNNYVSVNKFNELVDRVVALETNTPPDPDPDPDPPTWTPRFAGDVPTGKARWGAAIGGNSDPVTRHENEVGRAMSLRRTFFGWRHINSGYLINTVRDDHNHGRLPWVSTKPPSAQGGTANGWASIAAGHHDGEIDALLHVLDAQNKPVWFTMHHEPENDGLPAKDWREMQVKIRQRITATGVTNVAFAPIYMSWTFDSRSGRNPADWWVDGVWDFLGVDHYVEKESERFLDPTSDSLWASALPFLRAKGLPFALGEWGNRGTDQAAGDDVRRLYDSIIGDDQFIGAAAFDSGLNSPLGSYELKGEQLSAFREAMVDPRTLLV